MIQFFSAQHNPRTASVMVFVASSLWGLLWVPMRLTESMGVAPLWVHFWFTTMPALFLACLCLRSTLQERENWSVYLLSGMFIGIGYTLYAVGLLVGSVSKTTVLFYLTPIWSTLLAWSFWLKGQVQGDGCHCHGDAWVLPCDADQPAPDAP